MIRIIYSTTSGNTQLVIRALEEQLTNDGIPYETRRAEEL